jgi:hypothetical protein
VNALPLGWFREKYARACRRNGEKYVTGPSKSGKNMQLALLGVFVVVDCTHNRLWDQINVKTKN